MDKPQNMRVEWGNQQHLWTFYTCVLQGPCRWLNSTQQKEIKWKCQFHANSWKYVSGAFNEETSFWNILAIYRKREREREEKLSKYYFALYNDVFKGDEGMFWVYWPEEQADPCFHVPAGRSPSRQPWSRLPAAHKSEIHYNMGSACRLNMCSTFSRKNSGLWAFRTGVVSTCPVQPLYEFQ